MNKKTRLKLIKKTYHDTRRRRRKLTPKTWQLIRELRDESELSEVTDTVVDFREEDIQEEIGLMGAMRRTSDSEGDWDISRYYDTNLSLENLYFQGSKNLN